MSTTCWRIDDVHTVSITASTRSDPGPGANRFESAGAGRARCLDAIPGGRSWPSSVSWNGQTPRVAGPPSRAGAVLPELIGLPPLFVSGKKTMVQRPGAGVPARGHVVLASADSEAFTSLRRRSTSRLDRYRMGKELRRQVPRRLLGEWSVQTDRPDPVQLRCRPSPVRPAVRRPDRGRSRRSGQGRQPGRRAHRARPMNGGQPAPYRRLACRDLSGTAGSVRFGEFEFNHGRERTGFTTGSRIMRRFAWFCG